MKLSNEQYERIQRWMYRNARPLDIARWQYLFEGGSKDNVVKALEAYQNPDGGFGHGLEADCWNPNSAPMQTWWAIQFIRELDLEKSHMMIQDVLAYLASGDSYVDGRWLNSIASNNDYPGAPWWQYSEDNTSNISFNPSAALAGFILKYASEGSDIYNQGMNLAKEAVTYILEAQDQVEMHELACFNELAMDLKSLSIEGFNNLEDYVVKLGQLVDNNIERNTSLWTTSYCCTPSHYIKKPTSPFIDANIDLVEDELDLFIKSMNLEGVWDVTWQWGKDDREFAISSRWWQGHVVIEKVGMLKEFKRLEV